VPVIAEHGQQVRDPLTVYDEVTIESVTLP
jgi:hypothetical protein